MLAALILLQASVDDTIAQIVDAVADQKWGALAAILFTVVVAVGRAVMKRRAAAKADAAGKEAVAAKPADGAAGLVDLKK